ncbi:uncharacterized protein TM35_000901130, partial [Trypanosoma theileri]
SGTLREGASAFSGHVSPSGRSAPSEVPLVQFVPGGVTWRRILVSLSVSGTWSERSAAGTSSARTCTHAHESRRARIHSTWRIITIAILLAVVLLQPLRKKTETK